MEETLKANTRYIKEIYALYGGDDETEKILDKFREVKFYINERDVLSKTDADFKKADENRFVIKDGIRGVVLREILKHCKVGDWVTLMHGDEIFYHDPNAAAALAVISEHNTIVWFACHFFLTPYDRSEWDQLKNKPLQERITWYATNEYPWTEPRQFQIQPDSYYDPETHSRVVPYSDEIKIMPTCPVFKHYKVWNPDPDAYEVVYSKKYKRNVSREKGKWGTLPWEINCFEDFFVEHLPGYKEKHKFINDFGRFEEHFNGMLDQLNDYLVRNNLKLTDIIENAPISTVQ
ncbi:MAG: hypothetical protein JRF57_09985 [Deltaproteobacteria bacterium]|nr:hypothetical protein [Deltaproteobacteria bacterium]